VVAKRTAGMVAAAWATAVWRAAAEEAVKAAARAAGG